MLNTLGLSEEDRNDYLKKGIKDFEGTAKKAFHEVNSEHRVDLGAGRLTNADLKIRRGTITLDGLVPFIIATLGLLTPFSYSQTIQSFFDHCVEETVASVRQQMEGVNPKVIISPSSANATLTPSHSIYC